MNEQNPNLPPVEFKDRRTGLIIFGILTILLGYPEQQIEQMQKFSFLTGGVMAWGMLVFMLPFLGYLIYVKRYFRRAA